MRLEKWSGIPRPVRIHSRFGSLSGGVYTTFDYNNQSTNLTAASAINDNGQIVGRYIDGTTGASGGFLYELTAETFTSIQYPGAFQTMLGGISNSGTIVGAASLVGRIGPR